MPPIHPSDDSDKPFEYRPVKHLCPNPMHDLKDSYWSKSLVADALQGTGR